MSDVCYLERFCESLLQEKLEIMLGESLRFTLTLAKLLAST